MIATRTSTLTIRRATVSDAGAIALLTNELGYATEMAAMRQRVEAVMASGNDLLLVAVEASEAVGGWLQAHAAHIVESGFRVELTGLIVGSRFRRQGVGRALVAEAERWAAAIGAATVVVRSNVKRIESHAFYPALGYATTKTQMVYRKSLAVTGAASVIQQA